MKKCSTCGIVKPPDAFSPDRRHASGLQSQCRECYNERRRQRMQDPDKRERVRELDRARYARDPEKRKAIIARTPSHEPEALKQRMRQYWAENRDRLKEYNKQRYWSDPERYRRDASERGKTWRKEHPVEWKERIPILNARRRARMLASTPIIEPIDLSAIWKRDHGRCQLCGEKVDPALKWPHPWSRSYHHVIPLAEGGPHTMANLVLTHLRCNTALRDRPTEGQLWLV